MTTIFHVHPVDDDREHVLRGLTCWCHPRWEMENGEPVVIHNSADGREDFESGKRKVS